MNNHNNMKPLNSKKCNVMQFINIEIFNKLIKCNLIFHL